MRLVLAFMATGCGHRAPDSPAPESAGAQQPASESAQQRPDPFAEVAGFAETVANRGAVLPESDPWGEDTRSIRYLDQNWGPIETLWFYYTSQGSRLIPRAVLLNLEQPAGTDTLASAETFARYRFLSQLPTPNNPDGLPVGFAVDGDHVGLTCAACHTGQIIYEDTTLRIDGAPALADLIGLLREVQSSIHATLGDEEKLSRFVDAVGATEDDEVAAARLSLERSQQFFDSYLPQFDEVDGGYGRIDAVGGIVNQVIRFSSGTTNSISANAPTSYPVLWDAPRHDYLQWSGFSDNHGPGSLARNVGEVVGVFGEVHVTGIHSDKENRAGFTSSVKAHNLVDMEEALWNLQSPVWPEDILPPIDTELAGRGEALYAQECVSCHALIDRADPDRRVTAQVIDLKEVDTDPRTALNLVEARVPAGVLEGSLIADGVGIYSTEISGFDALGATVINVLKQNKAAAIRSLVNSKRWGLSEQTPKQGSYTRDTPDDPLASMRAYKARPLNGSWASAPYLHNGSVPTLYDLLLPEDERPTRFAVGHWRFDPVRVGYVTDGSEPWVFDTTVSGNHNTGHRFGGELSDEDRWALVEYLKTL